MCNQRTFFCENEVQFYTVVVHICVNLFCLLECLLVSIFYCINQGRYFYLNDNVQFLFKDYTIFINKIIYLQLYQLCVFSLLDRTIHHFTVRLVVEITTDQSIQPCLMTIRQFCILSNCCAPQQFNNDCSRYSYKLQQSLS